MRHLTVMTLPPLMFLLVISCLGRVVAVRLDYDPDVIFQLQRSAEDVPDNSEESIPTNLDLPVMDQPIPVSYRPSLIKLLLQDREDLLKYIRNNNKVKRTRQCYWSAVSCF